MASFGAVRSVWQRDPGGQDRAFGTPYTQPVRQGPELRTCTHGTLEARPVTPDLTIEVSSYTPLLRQLVRWLTDAARQADNRAVAGRPFMRAAETT
jgi:hypothetical protein